MRAFFLCVVFLIPSLVFAGYTATIAVEMAATTMEVKEKPKVPRSQCPECRGTGKVKAGDGRTIVERECENCYDDTPETKPKPKPIRERRVRILFFTATWCGPCQRVKNHVLPSTSDQGWTYGDGPENHIQLIDVDQHPDLARQYGITAYPTFILIKHGRPVEGGFHSGYLSAQGLSNLYNTATP